jgi:hypothetical protein
VTDHVVERIAVAFAGEGHQSVQIIAHVDHLTTRGAGGLRPVPTT